ncbi:hypothetical protein J7I98_37985 [Streptomyces sp. ISL-98]|uniref:sensor histidine kinase n=1 Tax=Streptomyces sp. ISL-98 TaxID=2819192 RepID=UPI001BEC9D1E|nr:histidine kinase [Streptomyces sp. ISL-98]MBT2511488.1 hypothetical protein [Streptomyces sp. ISL-98]
MFDQSQAAGPRYQRAFGAVGVWDMFTRSLRPDSGGHRRLGVAVRPKRRTLAYDAVLTVAVTAYTLFVQLILLPALAAADPKYAAVIPVGNLRLLIIVVSVLASLALALRRRWPLIPAVLAIVELWLQRGSPFLYPIALYTLVTRGRPGWAALTAMAGAAVPVFVPLPTLALAPPLPFPALVTFTVKMYILPTIVLPVLIAATVRTHRLHIGIIKDHAHRLKREQRLSASNARLEERARFARDLHDGVAHYVGLMIIQAGALEVRSSGAPEVTCTAALIGDLGRQGMAELRDLLDLLRSDPNATDGMSDQMADETWRREVQELVDRTQQAGARVTWRMTGEILHAGSAANRTAYRVIQEGISNAIRHAHGAEIDVAVVARPHLLEVVVRNGPKAAQGDAAARSLGSGYGLRGMRERVTQTGGVLLADATPDGGFHLSASIPTIGQPHDPRPSRRRRGNGARRDPIGARSL